MKSQPFDLEISGLNHSYGRGGASAHVLKDFSLHVQPGEFMTLLGPSGSGKSTALRLVAGYLMADSGSIRIGGQDVTSLPARARDIGMVFQQFALFPHMTVEQNVGFGLRMRRVPNREISARVAEMLEVVHLSQLSKRYPGQLSGGQQQRVALARALAIRPKVLLFDEPLSSLDAKLRQTLQYEIRRIQRELGVTTVYVTHDQGEALSMSDRVAVMNEGRIEQCSSPTGIYDKPESLFVARFVGELNTVPGTVVSSDRSGQRVRLGSGDGGDLLVAHDAQLAAGSDVMVAIRPERIRIVKNLAPGAGGLRGTVVAVSFSGRDQTVRVQTADGSTVQVLDSRRVASVGDDVVLEVPATDCSLF